MAFSLKKTNRSLIFIAVLTVTLLILFTLFTQAQFEDSTVEFRKKELRRLVTIAENSISVFREEYRTGLTSRDEAIEKITSRIRLLTYEDETQDNYIFMSAYDGTMLVQPYEPEKEGMNQWDLQDSDGKYIIRELVKTAEKGEGWVSYTYFAPESETHYNKISFVRGLPELDCYIGTGMYLNDLEAAGKIHFRRIHLFFLMLAAVLIGSATVVLLPIIRSVEYISGKFLNLDGSPLIVPPDLDRDKFREGSDAHRLVNGFAEITVRLAKRNRELIRETREKELLMKEMNHRVKNNLQIIISLFQVQLQETTNSEMQKMLIESIGRMESISTIHNMLYTGDDYSSISADDYLTRISGYIIHSFGADDRVSLNYDFDPIMLSIDNAVTIGIILNEALTNSVKYAFDRSGRGVIRISLKNSGDRKLFVISDNGSGMADGTEAGLGVTLIESLCKQLNAELSVEGNSGTSYSILW